MKERPNVPRVSGFEIHLCRDPDCGPHIMIEVGGALFCELVLHREGTLSVIEALQAALYQKAVERDDD